MAWVNPIYDRTIQDVEYVRENRANSAYFKGAMNYVDWQRITGNIHHIHGMLVSQGYIVPAMTCKTSWTLGEVYFEQEITKIRTDLNTLKSVESWVVTPNVPNLPYNYFITINIVEEILWRLELFLTNQKEETIYSGEINSGENDFT